MIYHLTTTAVPRLTGWENTGPIVAILNWSPSYSVGVAVLDEEHRHLVDLLNQLYDSIIDGSANDAKCARILDQVFEFADEHCDHEEKMLAAAGYPNLPFVGQQHENLREHIRRFKTKLTTEGAVSFDLANFLMEWILQHILKEDKKCGAFLNAAGIH